MGRISAQSRNRHCLNSLALLRHFRHYSHNLSYRTSVPQLVSKEQPPSKFRATIDYERHGMSCIKEQIPGTHSLQKQQAVQQSKILLNYNTGFVKDWCLKAH
jgi:hypothetical protein